LCKPEELLEEQVMNDPIVEEVRAAREAYARKFNYDLRAMVEDLKERQKQSGRKVVTLPPKLSGDGKTGSQEVA
jgi:hypothetical protein